MMSVLAFFIYTMNVRSSTIAKAIQNRNEERTNKGKSLGSDSAATIHFSINLPSAFSAYSSIQAGRVRLRARLLLDRLQSSRGVAFDSFDGFQHVQNTFL